MNREIVIEVISPWSKALLWNALSNRPFVAVTFSVGDESFHGLMWLEISSESITIPVMQQRSW